MGTHPDAVLNQFPFPPGALSERLRESILLQPQVDFSCGLIPKPFMKSSTNSNSKSQNERVLKKNN